MRFSRLRRLNMKKTKSRRLRLRRRLRFRVRRFRVGVHVEVVERRTFDVIRRLLFRFHPMRPCYNCRTPLLR